MSTSKLTYRSVRARPVLLPLQIPIVSRVGLFEEWPFIVIDIETEEGITGSSYLEPYIARSARYLVKMLEDLGEMLKGLPIAPLDDFAKGMGSLHLVGRAGLSQIAVAGLDMAAWDALAKAAQMPLAQFLGGSVAPVPAYNSNGLWLIDVGKVGEQAQMLVGQGNFRGLKLRLGRERLADDIAAIEAVRAAVGDDVLLMVDFNQGLSLGDALHRLQGLDDQGLYWFEEPVQYDNFEGYARIVRKLKTPMQLGENFYGPRDLADAIRAGACDYVMPDLMRIGGVTGWLQSAAIAAAEGIEVSTHLYPEVSAHLMRVTPTAHWLEWQDWGNKLLAEPFAITDGMITIPDRPGNGLVWDEDAIKHYSY